MNISERLYEVLVKLGDSKNSESLAEAESDDELPLECCFCAELFFDKEKFTAHDCRKISSPENDKPHSCTYGDCTKSFKKSSDLRKHMRIHLNIRKFACNECPKDFIHQTSLKNHLLTHSKIKNFVCNVCGSAFSTAGNLNQHKANHDEVSQKKFRCEFCDKMFSRLSNMKEHVTTHTKEKCFKCTSCEKMFSSSSSLAKHKKLHKDSKPFSCPFASCEKLFRQHSHLQKHLNSSIHSNCNTCDVCKQTFKRFDSLLSHMKIHEKPPKTVIISDEIIKQPDGVS